MSEPANPTWKYLARKPGSSYRQLFLRPWNIAARTIYGCYMSEEEPMTPEQIAEDRQIPLDAVLEAIAYCETDPPEIREDWEIEEAMVEAAGYNDPEYRRTGKVEGLSIDDIIRIRHRRQ
jgi:hypothetical protein